MQDLSTRPRPTAPGFELGRAEWAALTDLGIPAIHAKIDTGARTSALHATRVEVIGPTGHQRVRFVVQPMPGRRDTARRCEAPLLARRWVTSSNGARELRCVIATTIAIGARRWPIEVTLTNRRTMRHRMLLGRQAILDDMVVLPSQPNRQPVIPVTVFTPELSETVVARPATQGGTQGMSRGRRPLGSGLRIALLGEAPVGPAWQRLAEAAARRGHVVDRLDPRTCVLRLQPWPGVVETAGRIVPPPDAVIALLNAAPGQTALGQTALGQTALGQTALGQIGAGERAPAKSAPGRATIGWTGAPFALPLLRHFEEAGAIAPNPAHGMALVLDPIQGWQRLTAARIAVAPRALSAAGPELAPGFDLAPISLLIVSGRVMAVRAKPGKRGIAKWTTAAAEGSLAVAAARVLGLGVVRIDLIRSPSGTTAVAGFDASAGLADLSASAGTDPAAAIIEAIEARVRSSLEL